MGSDHKCRGRTAQRHKKGEDLMNHKVWRTLQATQNESSFVPKKKYFVYFFSGTGAFSAVSLRDGGSTDGSAQL